MKISLPLLLDLLVLAGEAAWVYAWSVTVGAWIGGARSPLLSLPVVLLLLALSAFLARLSARARERRWLRVVVVGAGVCAALIPILIVVGPPPDSPGDVQAWNSRLGGDDLARALLTAGTAALVWRRGLDAGRARLDLTGVEASFRTGVIAMSSVLAFVGLAGSAAPFASDALIPSTLVVLLSGLVAMPVARIAEVSARPRHSHSPGLMPGGPWLAMLLSIVATILAVTLILARLFTFDRIGAVLDTVGQATDGLLRTVIYILAIPFGLLVQALVFLAQLLMNPAAEPRRPIQSDTDWLSRLGDGAEAGGVSPELLVALKIGLGIVLAAVLVWILWRAVSRLGRLWTEDDVEESRDSVWLWPGWRAVWGWVLSRLSPIGARAAGMASIIRGQSAREERSVRGLYREMLRLGARFGHPRHLSETALEYEARLVRVAPDGESDLRVISDAYLHARYAQSAPEADLSILTLSLARLRAMFEGTEKGLEQDRQDVDG